MASSRQEALQLAWTHPGHQDGGGESFEPCLDEGGIGQHGIEQVRILRAQPGGGRTGDQRPVPTGDVPDQVLHRLRHTVLGVLGEELQDLLGGPPGIQGPVQRLIGEAELLGRAVPFRRGHQLQRFGQSGIQVAR